MAESKLISGPGVFKRLRVQGKHFIVSEPEAARRAKLKNCHLLPRGEMAKTWPAVEGLMTAMLKAGMDRQSTLVAVGGGAVTDAAGFAASVYLRGIPWISVPTTLLGQVDGGLGGKTAINLFEGKNLAGSFHQPDLVVCDTDFLKTLPKRDLISGMAEALKIGLVFDPAFWFRLAEGRVDLPKVVRTAAQWKLKVVALDERETKGLRELLNFGHTLGHAVETVAGHGRLRHGEAVIFGMRAALLLSPPHVELARAERVLAHLPVPLPRNLKARDILAVARRDKKARDGKIRFVLLRAPGKPFVKAVEEEEIIRVLEQLLP
jgi:3-dehydroquinate synthetase